MISRRQILSQTVSDEQTDQYQDLYSSGYGKVDEGDVWYTQDRLFEDHLSEIYNKWNFLDDDIWCKLIIMERNRRIGKAYARTPVLSIDGSYEFSFDGFRLGLNSFENPERDPITEECKTRIGKGIRIRMDESGNIIVMRFSKSNAFVKSWQHQLHNHNGSIIDQQQSSGSGSSNGGSSKLNIPPGKINSKTNDNNAGQMSANTLSPSLAHSSAADYNDHAISDEILKLNGKIEYNKTYLLFDMKKFQANIAHELSRHYPDKKKLEQQCFSIISLVADANDILNLPCWIMVINIVAIEMLESRFNTSANLDNIMSNGHHLTQPNFISIFDHKQGPNGHKFSKNNKEEDPYSIPANASTDSKSSTNNYGTTSTRNMSTINSSQSNRVHHQSNQYNGRSSSSTNNQYNHHLSRAVGHGQPSMSGNRSGSNNNIYGSASIAASLMPQHHQYSTNALNRSNNIVPPKLPPRAHAMKSHSKSTTNVSNYATDNSQRNGIDGNSKKFNNNDSNNNKDDGDASQQQKNRKTRRNRFLDTLQLPLTDLTNSKSSPSLATTSGASGDQLVGNQSGRPKATDATSVNTVSNDKAGKKNAKKSSKSKKISDGLKPQKSSSNKTKSNNTTNNSDEDSYANVEEDVDNSNCRENDADDVDSVVDGLDEDEVAIMSSGNVGIINDLDIPTPDYETDENIYSVDSNFQMPKSCMQQIYNKQKSLAKEDLYYSGLQARVPQNISTRHYSRKSQQQHRSYSPDRRDPSGSKEQRSNLASNNSRPTRLTSSNTNEKGIANQNSPASSNRNNSSSARYRSASMQRYYPTPENDGRSNIGYEYENPYSVGGYNIDHTSSRDYNRRSNYAINGINTVMNNKQLNTTTMSNVNYDIGRSSSGIYGNNSSSSSSDYADWHPQMRKHNSSGYLNSLFRNHVTSPIFYNTKPTPANNNRNNKQQLSTLLKQQQKQQLQQYGNCVVQTPSKQQAAIMHSNSKLQHQMIANNTNKRTNVDGIYRTYDSSNDSDPSYTNSSDGLDIYDQIGGHGPNTIEHQGSFMGPPTSSANHHSHHQRELYVGEWENL